MPAEAARTASNGRSLERRQAERGFVLPPRRRAIERRGGQPWACGSDTIFGTDVYDETRLLQYLLTYDNYPFTFWDLA